MIHQKHQSVIEKAGDFSLHGIYDTTTLKCNKLVMRKILQKCHRKDLFWPVFLWGHHRFLFEHISYIFIPYHENPWQMMLNWSTWLGEFKGYMVVNLRHIELGVLSNSFKAQRRVLRETYGNRQITNLPFRDGLYHPFMAVLGIPSGNLLRSKLENHHF